MLFTDDTDAALQTAAILANSGDEPGEPLGSVDDLAEFLREWGYTGRIDGSASELDRVRALRPALRAMLLAPRDEAVDLVNSMLAQARALPRLVRHEPWDWHLHAIDDDRPLADRIGVETAMAMIDVIRADEHSRISVCADEPCRGLVLDLSRNRSRRYCTTACGNRNAVAAYRARQASS